MGMGTGLEFFMSIANAGSHPESLDEIEEKRKNESPADAAFIEQFEVLCAKIEEMTRVCPAIAAVFSSDTINGITNVIEQLLFNGDSLTDIKLYLANEFSEEIPEEKMSVMLDFLFAKADALAQETVNQKSSTRYALHTVLQAPRKMLNGFRRAH